MSAFAQFWKWLTTSRYTRFLEEENAQLKRDNRQLVNNLLITGHMPTLHPVASISADRPRIGTQAVAQEARELKVVPPAGRTWGRQRQRLEREAHNQAIEQRKADEELREKWQIEASKAAQKTQ